MARSFQRIYKKNIYSLFYNKRARLGYWMSLAWQIMRLPGGTISVTSKLGIEMVFTL